MKIKEIREKNDKELIKMLAEKRESLRDIRFKIASNQYKNMKGISFLKKDIAKVLTVMKERILIDATNLTQILDKSNTETQIRAS